MTDVSTLLSRFSSCQPTFRWDTAAISAFAILHVAGLVIMALTEVGLIAKAAYLLVWGLLNFLLLVLLRRPAATALVSLVFIVALITVSLDKLWMTVDFVDLMIIDQDTSAFLLINLKTAKSLGLTLPPAVLARADEVLE